MNGSIQHTHTHTHTHALIHTHLTGLMATIEFAQMTSHGGVVMGKGDASAEKLFSILSRIIPFFSFLELTLNVEMV